MFNPSLDNLDKEFSVEQFVALENFLGDNIEKSLPILGVKYAVVSKKIIQEIVLRFTADIKRLFNGQDNGLHPAKYISYLCFWIRKLKPVSQAFPDNSVENNTIDTSKEVIDINEKIVLIILERYLITSALHHAFPEFQLIEKFKIDGSVAAEAVKSAIISYLNLGSDVGINIGTVKEALIYDMRYRSFGPHHLMHFCYHIISVVRNNNVNSN